MKVEIKEISDHDCFYREKDRLVGLAGDFEVTRKHDDGWIAGYFYTDNPFIEGTLLFYKVKIEPLE